MGVKKGYIQSDSHRFKRGQAIRGRIPWNKNKKIPESMRINISKAKCGAKNPFYGKKHSIETRLKMSNSHKGKSAYWNRNNSYKKGIKLSLESRTLIKKNRASQIFPKKDTKPERMMQIALSLNGIIFKKHKLITNNKDFWHQVDLFIEPNICIEIDGDYWHRRPEVVLRDMKINHTLNLLGYHIIRIWEKDIKIDTQLETTKIIKLLTQFKEVSVP